MKSMTKIKCFLKKKKKPKTNVNGFRKVIKRGGEFEKHTHKAQKVSWNHNEYM